MPEPPSLGMIVGWGAAIGIGLAVALAAFMGVLALLGVEWNSDGKDKQG